MEEHRRPKKEKSAEDATMMQIFVKHGQSTVVVLGVRERVFTLQALIHARLGILPKEQRLIFAGRQLNSMSRLSDYDIQDACTVHLVFRLRGSGPDDVAEEESEKKKHLQLHPDELMEELVARFGAEAMQVPLIDLRITTRSTMTVGRFISRVMGVTWTIIDSMPEFFPREVIFALAKAGLCDNRLPYSREQLAKVPGLAEAFQHDLYEAQSRYCAVFFDDKEHRILRSHESVPFRAVRGSRMRRGAFGTVLEVREGEVSFACKQLRFVVAREKEAANRELEMLQRLPQDPHLLSLRASYEQGSAMFFILFPFVDTDLDEFLAAPCKFKWWKEARERMIAGHMISDWMLCMARGLATLHMHCVKHRDVKPSNVGLFVNRLQNSAQNLAVYPVWLDFGVAKLFTKMSKSAGQAGTPLFESPESCRGRSADIFSMGTIYLHLLFLLNGVSLRKLKPYKNKGWKHICGKEGSVLAHLPSSNEGWIKMKTLISDMLHSDPHKRPTASNVVETLAHLQIVETDHSGGFVPHCLGVPLPRDEGSPPKTDSTSEGSREDGSEEGSDEGSVGEQLWSTSSSGGLGRQLWPLRLIEDEADSVAEDDISQQQAVDT